MACPSPVGEAADSKRGGEEEGDARARTHRITVCEVSRTAQGTPPTAIDTSVISVEKLDPRIVSVVPPSMLPPAGSMLSIVAAYPGGIRGGGKGGGRENVRESVCERVRERDRQRDRGTERQRDKETERQRERHRERCM